MNRVLVSGIQASGGLHLGNYIGALRRWVELQDEYDCFWFIADLHALTTPHEVTTLNLAQSTREMAALYMAVGLDPSEATIFRQSDVRAHTELNWLLNCVTPTGWLNRMTQFKAKAHDRSDQKISTGLYTYPVLQAADILLYRASAVPVGADQVQHIELAREIARRWNSLFGDTFVEPVPIVPASGARIMGLDDCTRKMSKTIAATSPGNAVFLLDPPKAARRKIMRAQTDSGSTISFDVARSSMGVINLLTIYRALTGHPPEELEDAFEGEGYGTLKAAVADVVCAFLEDIQKRYRELLDDSQAIDEVLVEGAARARGVAERTLAHAREALGLDPTHL